MACSFQLKQVLVLPPLPKEQAHLEIWQGNGDFRWGKQWWAPFGRAIVRRSRVSIAQDSSRGLGFSFPSLNLKSFTSALVNLILISLFCSSFVWICLNSSSCILRKLSSYSFDFSCCKEATQAKQQPDWEGRSGGLELASPVMQEIISMIFISWLVYLGGERTLIFPKPSAHFSSTHSWFWTESLILRNTRNLCPLPNPNSLIILEKYPRQSLYPWRVSTEA